MPPAVLAEAQVVAHGSPNTIGLTAPATKRNAAERFFEPASAERFPPHRVKWNGTGADRLQGSNIGHGNRESGTRATRIKLRECEPRCAPGRAFLLSLDSRAHAHDGIRTARRLGGAGQGLEWGPLSRA